MRCKGGGCNARARRCETQTAGVASGVPPGAHSPRNLQTCLGNKGMTLMPHAGDTERWRFSLRGMRLVSGAFLESDEVASLRRGSLDVGVT
jgi:hypothetical protein